MKYVVKSNSCAFFNLFTYNEKKTLSQKLNLGLRTLCHGDLCWRDLLIPILGMVSNIPSGGLKHRV